MRRPPNSMVSSETTGDDLEFLDGRVLYSKPFNGAGGDISTLGKEGHSSEESGALDIMNHIVFSLRAAK